MQPAAKDMDRLLRDEAEKKLKSLQFEVKAEQQAKQAIKKTNVELDLLLKAVMTSPEPTALLSRLSQQIADQLTLLQEEQKQEVEREAELVRQRERINRQQMEDHQLIDSNRKWIQEIRRKIKELQAKVAALKEAEEKDRIKIRADIGQSLSEAKTKIEEFKTEIAAKDQEIAANEIKAKALREQLDLKKDEFIGKETAMMSEKMGENTAMVDKLNILEKEMKEQQEKNKHLSAVERENMETKLGLYFKVKKFPDLVATIENNAKSVQTCREEIVKAVRRIVKADETVSENDKRIGEMTRAYLGEMKKAEERDAKLNDIKLQKEVVRTRIIELQAKIKAKNMQAEVKAA